MIVIILCCSILGLILFPSQAAQGAARGLSLCGSALIPALFPFFFLTKFLGERLPVGNGKKAMTSLIPVLMSFVGGYPTGVLCATSLYSSGRLSREEAQRLIPVCNNSGPGFFVGVLGAGIFQDPRRGLTLYFIHVYTALLLLLIRTDSGESPRTRLFCTAEKKPLPQLFQQVLGESCQAMLRVCGLVILFSVLRELLIPFLPGWLHKYWGLVELSSGILSTGGEDLILWSVMMGWGGLCVHLQAMSIWQEAGLHMKGYFPMKLLHGLLSGLCAAGVVYKKWEIFPFFLLFSILFSYFRKNRGRKKQKYAL